MKIGVFDSGLGGLSILRQMIETMPEYNFIYLGDNAHVPYGGRSPELIYQFTKKAVNYLFSQDCALIITACNTVTAIALRKIQDNYLPKHYPDRKILGVILPAAETICENNYKKVGVIGTKATIHSHEFEKKIKHLEEKVEVIEKACPLLVPVIEEEIYNQEVLDLLLEQYLTDFKKEKVEALILGCTHYGLIKKEIAAFLGDGVNLIDEAEICTNKLKKYLKTHPEIDKKLGKRSERNYLVTDLTATYQNFFDTFLGECFKKEDKLKLVKL